MNSLKPTSSSLYGACNAAYELKQALKRKDNERAQLRALKQANKVGV